MVVLKWPLPLSVKRECQFDLVDESTGEFLPCAILRKAAGIYTVEEGRKHEP